MVKSLAKPMIDGRVVVWLNGEAGVEFNKTLLAHSMTWSQDDVVVGFNNWTGNKMDFYLRAEVGWRACGTFILTLRSTADSEVAYPDYLARRLDYDDEYETLVGSLLDMNVVFPKGVKVLSVLTDGEMAAIDTYPISGNRTVVRNRTEIFVGSQTELVFSVDSDKECYSAAIRVAPLRQDVAVQES